LHLHFIYSVPSYIPPPPQNNAGFGSQPPTQNNAGFGSQPPTQNQVAYQPQPNTVQSSPTPQPYQLNSPPLNDPNQENFQLQVENREANRQERNNKEMRGWYCVIFWAIFPPLLLFIIVCVILLLPPKTWK
jgi:hypothetical protein